jgi:methyl-accepting chemotaxis protein
MEQMTASIAQNNENAKVTGEIAKKTARETVEGGQAVRETVTAMQQIARKIAIIDEIAYQTNLLPLNAAIEAGRAGTLLEAIVPSIQKTADLVEEITAASEEQSSGMGQVGTAMSHISQAVQQNAAASEELASTSEEVNAQSMELQSLMAFFTLAEAPEQRGAPARRPAPRAPRPAVALPRRQLAPGTPPNASDFSRF